MKRSAPDATPPCAIAVPASVQSGLADQTAALLPWAVLACTPWIAHPHSPAALAVPPAVAALAGADWLLARWLRRYAGR